MLQANNIVKSYGDLEVLKGLSIEVADKEIISITGASGAGKSTLLHILSTLDVADAGKVLMDNEDITLFNDRKRANFRNKKVGFIFQFHNLLPEFTAIENVTIPALIAGKNFSDAKSNGLKLLERLGVSNRAYHKPSTLSGGEQQRVAVARALINSPSIVFADEPSGNLDSSNAEELHKLFFELRDEFGQSFIIVTHNNHLADMADRKLEMKDGIFIPKP